MSINICNLSLSYGDKVVLDNISCAFARGNVSVILGRSGCGKTSLINCMAGLLPYSGSIDGIDSVGYVFQQPRLVPNISVYDNLQLTTKHVIVNKAQRHQAIMDILQQVELTDKADRRCQSLSGGEAQRVSIARAFLSGSELLLLDEPMQGLDIVAKQTLTNMLTTLIDSYKRTVLYVTHDLYDCLAIADDIFVMGGKPCGIEHVVSISDSHTYRDVASQYTNIKQLLIDNLTNS